MQQHRPSIGQLNLKANHRMTARARFTQADLTRLFKSLRDAGYKSFKVVIEPDGTIVTHVPEDLENEPEPSLADYL